MNDKAEHEASDPIKTEDLQGTIQRIDELPELKALYFSTEPNGMPTECSGLITNELKRLLAETLRLRQERDELIEVFKRNIAMHENSPVFTTDRFSDDVKREHIGFVRGLKRGLEIVELCQKVEA